MGGVVSRCMPAFPLLGASAWLPRGDDLLAFALFEEVPAEKKRARIIAGMPRFLRERLEWRGPLVAFGARRIAAHVRKGFRAVESFALTPEDLALLRGEDVEAGALPDVEQALRDYGDSAPWMRFHAAVHQWLAKVHGRSSIALYVCPGLPEPEPESPVHRRGLDALFANAERIAALHGDGSPQDIGRRFMEALAPFAATDLERAAAFAPCLAHSFGTGACAEASLALLGALRDAERTAFLAELAPVARLALLLRTDALPAHLARGGLGDELAEAFAAFRTSEPGAGAIDQVVFRIQNALAPAAEHADRSPLDVLLGELETQSALYAPSRARLGPLVPVLERNGPPAPPPRLARALQAMS